MFSKTPIFVLLSSEPLLSENFGPLMWGKDTLGKRYMVFNIYFL